MTNNQKQQDKLKCSECGKDLNDMYDSGVVCHECVMKLCDKAYPKAGEKQEREGGDKD